MASSIFDILAYVLAFQALLASGSQLSSRACTRTVNAKDGDSCATLSRSAGITVTQFINFNPSVTSCGSLVPGAAYCVATDGTAPPAETSPSLAITKDGQCGNGVTCAGSAYGDCCSEHGWCGSSEEHCGVGCQSAFGKCAAGSGPGTTSPGPSPTSPGVTTSIATLPPRPTTTARTTIVETRTSFIVSTITSTAVTTSTAIKTSTTTKTSQVFTTSTRFISAVATETATETVTSTVLKSSVTTLTSLTVKTSTINEIRTITTATTSVVFQTFRITSIETSTFYLTERACPTVGRPPSNTNVAAPSPTQEGLIRGCKDFYKVKQGDYCDKIVQMYGTFTIVDFYKWNPSIDCSNMWAGYYVCVGV